MDRIGLSGVPFCAPDYEMGQGPLTGEGLGETIEHVVERVGQNAQLGVLA